jgi:hypothetical protein
MKVLLKSLFFALTLTILSYSAVQAGARDLLVAEPAERKCCTYQVDCPEDQECKYIFPYCSEANKYICKAAAADEAEAEVLP